MKYFVKYLKLNLKCYVFLTVSSFKIPFLIMSTILKGRLVVLYKYIVFLFISYVILKATLS